MLREGAKNTLRGGAQNCAAFGRKWVPQPLLGAQEEMESVLIRLIKYPSLPTKFMYLQAHSSLGSDRFSQII